MLLEEFLISGFCTVSLNGDSINTKPTMESWTDEWSLRSTNILIFSKLNFIGFYIQYLQFGPLLRLV